MYPFTRSFRIVVRPGATFESRLHFMNAAAQAMKRILFQERLMHQRGALQGVIFAFFGHEPA